MVAEKVLMSKFLTALKLANMILNVCERYPEYTKGIDSIDDKAKIDPFGDDDTSNFFMTKSVSDNSHYEYEVRVTRRLRKIDD